ncbi:MAG: translocation/assembly module TamB [Holosporales bacterium]|nr:translocation/assembly module TamB [Holosporales bacterium]
MRVGVVIRHIALRILIVVVSVISILSFLQIAAIQKQLVKLLVPDTLHVNFSHTMGLFPFKFSVIGLEVSDDELTSKVDKISVQMSKSMLRIKSLDIGNAEVKMANETKISLSSIRYFTPLFFQKFIKSASIANVDYNGIALKKILFTHDRKTGTRHISLSAQDNLLDCQWNVVGTRVIADVGINDTLANISYDAAVNHVAISLKHNGETYTFDGVCSNLDKLSGVISLPLRNLKLASEITVQDDVVDVKFQSQQIGLSGNVEYDINTDFVLCNNVRFADGIAMMPFTIRSDLEIPELTVLVGNGRIYFKDINLASDKFSPGNITFSNVDIARFTNSQCSGLLNGACKYEHGAEQAKLRLTNFEMGTIKIPVVNIDAVYSPDAVTARFMFDFLKKKNKIDVRVAAENWMISGASAIQVHGTGKFNVAEYKLPVNQSAGGTIVYNLQATGTCERPIFSGELTLKKGHYINTDGGIYMQNVRLNCGIKNNAIIIKDIYLTDDAKTPGDITGSGKISIDVNKANVSIALKVNNLSIIEQNWVTARLSGDVSIDGDLYEKCTISGHLSTSGAKMDVSSMILMSARSLDVSKPSDTNDPSTSATTTTTVPSHQITPEAADPATDYLKRIAINVSLTNELTIIGMGISSTWKGDGEISGTLNDVHYNVSWSLIKGSITVNDSTFKLKNGKLLISDGNFDVDVSAEKHVDSTIVGARFIQHNGESRVKFYSTPPMSKNDVLSYMLYDKKASEISASEGLAMFSIMNKVTGIGGFDLINKMKAVFGLDSIGIKKSKDSNNAEYNAISVGKKIGSMRVSVEQGASKDTTAVTVETKVAKNTRVSVDLSGRNLFGAGLLWSKRY